MDTSRDARVRELTVRIEEQAGGYAYFMVTEAIHQLK